jgi:hypothetical protein
MMNEMGNYDAYKILIEDFDETGSYQGKDIVSVNDFTDDPGAVKYCGKDNEAAIAEEYFKEKKSKTQPRTQNIRSKAELEKNEDKDFLIKVLFSAARATSSGMYLPIQASICISNQYTNKIKMAYITFA